MKKLTILLVFVLSTLFALAQNSRIDLRSTSRAEITKSDFASLRAVFSYGSIESVEMSTEKGVFSEIFMEGTYISGEIGAPELPASHQLLAVPFGATPQVNILSYTTTDYNLSDYGINTILPHQPSVRKDQKPEDVVFMYDAEAYQTRGLASAPNASIEVQGTMRGIRIGSLVINPVSYNPATNTLRVFNDIEVEVNFEGADRDETERMLLNTYSPYFDIVYKQMFNYRQIMDVYDDHPDLMAYPVHMIVITPENYVSTLQPWLNWKIQKGFNVNVVTTAQAGNTYSAIRSYVQNLYNTGVSQGATPTFLILVGDVAQVPNTTGSATQKVTDLYYGSVDNDYFPDIFYSRMSAENTSQLTAIINKVLQYEQYTMPDPSYLNNVTLIAGWDSYWTSYVGAPTVNYATTYYYNTAHGFTTVNSHVNQSQYNGCYNSLSSGVGFVNYTAHGDNNMWYQPQFTNSNVNQLTNTNKYFLAMGNCCLSGNFGYNSTCFGEAMIRAENKGAYSYIGSCPNTYWYEDYYFGVGATNTFGSTPNINNTKTGVYDAVWMDDTYNTVSSMTFLGNIAVCYSYTGGYQTSINATYYWQAYHVLGDGSIMPYRVNPTANNVSHATSIPAGATSFTVNAQAGSYVGISHNNTLLGAALVPASGTVNVPITPVNSGQVRIVVTKPQRQPYIQDISVSGGVQTHTVTISANPDQGGTVAFGTKDNRDDIFCSFEGEIPSGWTLIDADGDGHNWTLSSTLWPAGYYIPSHSGDDCISSASYDNTNQVALTPDNYLVSPQLTLGGSITFWACAQDAAWASEHFGVAVSTTTATANAFTTIQEWTMTAKGSGVPTHSTRDGQTRDLGNWYEYTVDLSAFNGQTGYVAIRHFNCTDWFYLNVDDITITEGNSSGNTTSATFNHGESCTVTATANSGYTFTNWTENGTVVSTNASYTFTVNNDRTLVANFTVPTPTYNISVSANPTNGGTVTGGGTFNQGTSCTVSATANSGYNFVNWTENGTVVSTNASYTFTVTSNRTLVANFTLQTYNVSLSAVPVEGGTVTGSGTYTHGQSCTVIATANSGYNFTNWTENGTVVSTNASYTFTVNGNRTLVANFELIPIPEYTIGVSVNPEEGGMASGGGIYQEGEEVTVSVETNEYFIFVNWTENGEVVSEDQTYTFVVTGNRTLVANLLSTVGVGEQESRVVIYPNPVQDKLVVVADENVNNVEIYNVTGALVYSQKCNMGKVEIQTGSLPSGTYIIRLTTDNSMIMRRFVKD